MAPGQLPTAISLRHIVAANTLLTAVAVSLALWYMRKDVLLQYYKTLWPLLSDRGIIVLHVTIHYLPLLWTGVYFRATDALLAVSVYGLWYTLNRHSIRHIYTDQLHIETYDRVVLSSSYFIVMYGTMCDLLINGRAARVQ